MSYKEKYKQALERAREQYNKRTPLYDIESIFPELQEQESEDEKIKKAIHIYLDWLDGRKNYAPKGNYSIKDMISWLEKQGKEEYALKSFRDKDVHKFMQYIEKQAKAYEFNLPNKSYDIYAFAKDILHWLEKQGEKSTTINIDKMVMEYSQTKDDDFGLPVNCMLRAYRKGINDALSITLFKKDFGL